jgi:hypothetical protein
MPGDDSHEHLPKKKSPLRLEIEAALAEKGISVERRITVINLDSRETAYFEDYHQALEFMKGKKGRWYLATPGLRRR